MQDSVSCERGACRLEISKSDDLEGSPAAYTGIFGTLTHEKGMALNTTHLLPIELTSATTATVEAIQSTSSFSFVHFLFVGGAL